MELRITRAETVWGSSGGSKLQSVRGSLSGGLARIASADGVQKGGYAEYELGVFADSPAGRQGCPSACLHTINGRYSSLRATYSQLPASVPGCRAKFPDKRLVQDGVFQERRKEADIEKRAQALRDFFAELLLNNEASEAANLRLHQQMDISEDTSRLLCAALAEKQAARGETLSPRRSAKAGGSGSGLDSRRRDCHFDDTVLSLLKRLMTAEAAE